MDVNFSSFYTWFISGLTTGVILTKIIELAWSRFTQNSDIARDRKDAIGQEFKKIFLEGKGNNFSIPPKGQDRFRNVILDIEKYDMKLSNKLSDCRFSWGLSALRTDKIAAQAAQLNPDLKQLDQWRQEANESIDEVKKEMEKNWLI